MDKLGRFLTRLPVVFVLLVLLGASVTLILCALKVYPVTVRMLSRQVGTYMSSAQALTMKNLQVKTTDRSAGEKGNSTSDLIIHCPQDIQVTEEKVALNLSAFSYDTLRQALGGILQIGGRYSPGTCKALEHVALIIPYRDREKNLHILLHNLVPFLVRQKLEFTIFVVEQTKDYLFNRCLMFNVGFVEAQKRGNFTCFILHDTDLIPRDNRNIYRCHDMPRHFVTSRSNENWEEQLPYSSFIGGVLGLRKEHINKSNGCSNYYYGWGLEDDDLELRLKNQRLLVVRYPAEIGAYYSLTHEKQTDNPRRDVLHRSISKRLYTDGLNSLQYELVDTKEKELYTWLLVKPPPPPASLYGTTPTP